MRCQYLARNVVKVFFSWNFFTELEKLKNSWEKAGFRIKRPQKFNENLAVELKFTLLTALKSGQMCRSGFPYALDKDGVKRFLDLHSITVQSWFLEKKKWNRKIIISKSKAPVRSSASWNHFPLQLFWKDLNFCATEKTERIIFCFRTELNIKILFITTSNALLFKLFCF